VAASNQIRVIAIRYGKLYTNPEAGRRRSTGVAPGLESPRRSWMIEDFKLILARVQSDYDFYVRLQENPEHSLATYDLTDEEREVLLDPDKLGQVLSGVVPEPGGEGSEPAFKITITICGTHDWFNPTNVSPPHISPPTISLTPPPPPGPPPPPPPGPPPPPPPPGPPPPPPPPGPPPPPPPPGPPPPPPPPGPPPGPPGPGDDGGHRINKAVEDVLAAATEPDRVSALVGLMELM
jgi:hypothetical protein